MSERYFTKSNSPPRVFFNFYKLYQVAQGFTYGLTLKAFWILLSLLFGDSHPKVFCKKILLKILRNSLENTCARVSFLIKLQAFLATLLKKRLWHRCFPLNFVKFLRTLFYGTPPGDCF